MRNLNKDFWDEFYKTENPQISKPSSFSYFVYTNYIEKYNDDNVYLKIADLGSGNCRDTIFFSRKKNLCYGIDVNGVLNEENINDKLCKFIKKDVLDVLKKYELQTLFDIIYMRWFLHALPYDISEDIFINSLHNLKPGGLICIEVRSINDKELQSKSVYDVKDKSCSSTHKRWLYNIEILENLATSNDCDVLYCKEDYFSPDENAETTNPLLIRFICKKKILPYYEKSENYCKYKHIIPKMSYSTEHYDKMSILNKIFEEKGIKYVAVAGTSLGLVRHGGIIPWDEDIDIGFVEEEWKKLYGIKDEFEKYGYEYSFKGQTHWHFGPIDCFKLRKKGNFYIGEARTYCSEDEYNNIAKQIYGYTYIYAPFCNHESLKKRYGDYFHIGDVNDNFHFSDKSVKRFNLNHNDLSYQLKLK